MGCSLQPAWKLLLSSRISWRWQLVRRFIRPTGYYYQKTGTAPSGVNKTAPGRRSRIRAGRFEEICRFRDRIITMRNRPGNSQQSTDKGESSGRFRLVSFELEAKAFTTRDTKSRRIDCTAGGLVFIAGTTDSRFGPFDAKLARNCGRTGWRQTGTNSDDLYGQTWKTICRYTGRRWRVSP